MKTIKTNGTVTSGQAIANQYTQIPWAKRQIEEKLGFTPYPGTLNLNLSDKEAKKVKDILKDSRGIGITPAEGFLPAQCFTAIVMDRVEGAIVLPQKTDYPPSLLEIAAPVYLRRELSLKDGDQIEITILPDQGP